MKLQNVLATIGNTPLIRLDKINPRIRAKLETVNPSGSIKDRIAKYMVEQAERKGQLKRGDTIIEATSGNTGISLSMVAAFKGYKMIAVMPENMTWERVALMKAFGAKVVLTPAKESLPGAIKKARELGQKINHAWLSRQFENLDNVKAHQKTTGREIIKQAGQIDAFVAGIGTGGTLMGVALALKKKFPKIKIIGVEAAESPHHIEGISDGLIPEILNYKLIDQIIKVKSSQAIAMSKLLALKQGLLVGVSSGANVVAAIKLSKKYKNVVTILPDRAERYLSNRHRHS